MIGPWLVIASLLLAQAEARPDDETRLAVRRLVQQLDAPQLAQREQAEDKLLDLGPSILGLLPALDRDSPAEIRERVGRIRQRLQRLAGESTAGASLITLHGQGMPLSKVLAALSAQSGNKVVDYRARLGQSEEDPNLDVDFRNVTFWKALDQIVDQAGLTVYPYQADVLNVVARPEGQMARTGAGIYRGPFRLEPLSLLGQRDLREPDHHALILKLEIAWEPRLRPIYFRQKMSDLEVLDDQGRPVPAGNRQLQSELPVTSGTTAAQFELALSAPRRDAQRLAVVRGKLTALLPGRIETFRFENPAQASNVEKRIGDVTVVLENARKNNDTWEVRVLQRFDRPGEALESHRGWIDRNEAFLEGPDGKLIPYGSREKTRESENQYGAAYVFDLEKLPPNAAFVYKTPSVIITAPFDYELKDLPLP